MVSENTGFMVVRGDSRRVERPELDISILEKTGHFYSGRTAAKAQPESPIGPGLATVKHGREWVLAGASIFRRPGGSDGAPPLHH